MEMGETVGVRGGPRTPGPSPYIAGGMDGNDGSCGTNGHRNERTRTRMHTAPGLVRGWFTDYNDGFQQELATKVNGGDAPNPLCPSLQALESMPSQHALVAKIYA